MERKVLTPGHREEANEEADHCEHGVGCILWYLVAQEVAHHAGEGHLGGHHDKPSANQKGQAANMIHQSQPNGPRAKLGYMEHKMRTSSGPVQVYVLLTR